MNTRGQDVVAALFAAAAVIAMALILITGVMNQIDCASYPVDAGPARCMR